MISQATLQFIVDALKKHVDFGTYNVFIFGSQAKGNVRRSSDIDVGIEGKKPVDLLTISDIKGDLEDSNIAETVDVVDFRRVSDNFAKVAKQNVISLH